MGIVDNWYLSPQTVKRSYHPYEKNEFKKSNLITLMVYDQTLEKKIHRQ